jgi:ABC-type microcin C transport system permease subunit YejB
VLSYTLRRLAATIPVMGVVALFVFSLLYLSPGDPAAVIAGDIATADDIARIRAKLGLDQPYFERFGTWLWALAHGDLGTSIFTGLPALLRSTTVPVAECCPPASDHVVLRPFGVATIVPRTPLLSVQVIWLPLWVMV